MWGKHECKSVSALLWDYAANRLTGSETKTVEAHLQYCAACQALAEEYRQTVTMVSAYRRESVPQSNVGWQAMRAQLEAPARSKAPHWTLRINSLTWAAGATCAAVVLLIGLNKNPVETSPTASYSAQVAPKSTGPVRPVSGPAKPEIASKDAKTEKTPSETVDPYTDSEDDYPEMSGTEASAASGKSASVQPAVYRPRTGSPRGLRNSSGRGPRINISNMGGDDSSAVNTPPQNYVLPPISSEEDDPHHYVIDTISSAPRTTSEESRTW